MKARSVIIDDEYKSVRLLESYLQPYLNRLSISGIAYSADEGFRLIKDLDPHIVFLDISMPGRNGLSMLDQFSSRHFNVIFITGHSEFALEAIDRNAVHYLLKPIDRGKLDESLRRCFERLGERETAGEVGSGNHLLSIGTSTGHRLIRVEEILYCEADGCYTTFFLRNTSEKVMASQNIKKYEEQLEGHHFMRIHKRFLVNLNYVRSYSKGKGGSLELQNGKQIEVSFRKKGELTSRLQAMCLDTDE